MRIGVLQHVAFESPGHIADWASIRGHEVALTRLFAGDVPPRIDALDALVIMGGPMSVRDQARHAWLAPEKRLIGGAIAAGKPVLGVCLGAQLVADVLGARVYSNREREIGWFPVSPTDAGATHAWYRLPGVVRAFHWHGETFDLPAGAVHLARSAACDHQMFAVGERIVALQFHLEVTREGIAEMIRHGESELAPGAFVQARDEMVDDRVDFNTPHLLLVSLLDRWCDGGAQ
jgi:GMP synthase-like glutamine amidotransferase